MRKTLKLIFGSFLVALIVTVIAGLGISHFDASLTFIEAFVISLLCVDLLLFIGAISIVIVLLVKDA